MPVLGITTTELQIQASGNRRCERLRCPEIFRLATDSELDHRRSRCEHFYGLDRCRTVVLVGWVR